MYEAEHVSEAIFDCDRERWMREGIGYRFSHRAPISDGSPDPMFHAGEHVFNRVEIGLVWRNK
jgi:hypothetical protein